MKRLALILLAACGTSSFYVANPSPPLVDSGAEPPGANCANGGTRVSTGYDADSDGVLSVAERLETSYVCAAPAPGKALVEVTAEPPGDVCPNGGRRVRLGADANADGLLADTEVTSTEYDCSPDALGRVYFGDYVVATPDDVTALSSYDIIAGSLVLDWHAGESIVVPANVRIIVDSVYLDTCSPGSGTLKRLTLAGVERASIRLNQTCGDDPIEELHMPALVQSPYLFLTGAFLTTLDASALTFANELYVADFLQPITFAFPALQQVHYLGLSSFNVNVSFPQLTTVLFGVDFQDEESSTYTFPVLTSVGAFNAEKADLAGVSLPALQTIAGDLQLIDLIGPTSLSFPALTTVADVRIEGNLELETVEFPALTQVEGGAVQNNLVLSKCVGLSLRALNNAVTTDDSGAECADPALACGPLAVSGATGFHYCELTQNAAQAAASCTAIGRSLASLTSLSELDAVLAAVSALQATVYTGCGDEAVSGTYTCPSGITLPSGDSRWAPGEPDDIDDSQGCMVLAELGVSDLSCSEPRHFLCR